MTTPVIAISRAIKNEVLFDINNGLFSDSLDSNNKYYRDEDNDLDIEVTSLFDNILDMWKFEVAICDDFGNEYNLDEGQWEKLNRALLEDVRWREKETASEAEFMKYLWGNA